MIREYNLQWKRATSQFIRYYVEGGLRTVVSPVPAWTRATSVNLNSDGSGTVIFEQCNDYRNVVVTRSGKPVKSAIPKHDVTPLSSTCRNLLVMTGRSLKSSSRT